MGNYSEFYISVDIEATGPNPGDYSMSSLGAFIAGARLKSGDYVRFDRHDAQNTFYIEFKPLNDNFIPDAIKVGLLEGFEADDPTGELRLQWMKDHGVEAADAIQQFARWVNLAQKRIEGARPLFTAYPAAFDWKFVSWYLDHFGVTSPFGFSGVKDLKETYATKADVPYSRATKRWMPKHLLKTDVPHTHHALDDAVGQGHMAMNLLEWKPTAEELRELHTKIGLS